MLWHAATADSYTSECGRYVLHHERVGFGNWIWRAYRDGKEAALHVTLKQSQQWAQEDSQK